MFFLPQAISCHYASSNCDYIDVAGTSQDIILKEVVEIVKRRLGEDAEITLDVRQQLQMLYYPFQHFSLDDMENQRSVRERENC